MSIDPSGEDEWAARWDRLFDALSAEPRRMILVRLADEPSKRSLPLPDTAESTNRSVDPETLRIRLRHHHLPKLESAGYIRWSDEPFSVQRGPNFAEPEFVVNELLESIDGMPQSLLDDCKNLQEMIEYGSG